MGVSAIDRMTIALEDRENAGVEDASGAGSRIEDEGEFAALREQRGAVGGRAAWSDFARRAIT